MGRAIQHGGNLDQSRQIGINVAANLELEIAVAVGCYGFLQRFRQAVANLSRMAADDIDQPYGMARGDGVRRCKLREKTRQVEFGEIVDIVAQQRRIDTGEVVAHAVVERAANRQEKRIENGAIELRRAVIGDQ